MIDVSAEWRVFENDSDSKNASRVGAAQNFLYDHDTFEIQTLPGKKTIASSTLEIPKPKAIISQVRFLV